MVPDVPGSTPVPYPNDPTDPTKPGNPVIPNIPGYTPVDPSGQPLTPGDTYPVEDTPLHYINLQLFLIVYRKSNVVTL